MVRFKYSIYSFQQSHIVRLLLLISIVLIIIYVGWSKVGKLKTQLFRLRSNIALPAIHKKQDNFEANYGMDYLTRYSQGGVVTGLVAEGLHFKLNGKIIRILSGALHYFRVVPDLWEDRLLKMKACGLNTVETYIPWNLHEEHRGNISFQGILDLRKFILLIQKMGMFVILRPGPYICAEWEFGGLPSWLLKDPNMKVRSSYGEFLDAVERYFAKLIPVFKDLQFTKGGPVIAVQIENEYSAYGSDDKYKEFLKNNLVKFGVQELLFTSDSGYQGFEGGSLPGVLITLNGQTDLKKKLLELKQLQPNKPLMVMEFWTGWFDHWGEDHHILATEKLEKELKDILEVGASVNFYMFHGGTNFNFWNGGNWENERYQPTITSYDYGAPLTESGDYNPKYHTIRKLCLEYMSEEEKKGVPEVPIVIKPTFPKQSIQLTHFLSFDHILDAHKVKIESRLTKPMENLDIYQGSGQNFGYIYYKTTITNLGGLLSFTEPIRDRAVVLLNNKQIGIIEYTSEIPEMTLPSASEKNTDLGILVENMGRINYVTTKDVEVFNYQRKGIIGDVLLNSHVLKQWTIHPLEFQTTFFHHIDKSPWKPFSVSTDTTNVPGLFKTELKLNSETQDMFINMEGWKEGCVFVNRFNIGRYSSKGPQKTLYIPAPILNADNNEIIIFELHNAHSWIVLQDFPILG